MRHVVIADASLLFALFNKRDFHHESAVEYVSELASHLTTTLAAVTETAHLLSVYPPARVDFITWIIAGGVFVVDLELEDYSAILQVVGKYEDLPADFGDATLVAIANRLEIQEVATFDSDFRVYKYQRRRHFKTPLLDVN